VRFDRFRAEEELHRDLGVRLPVDNQPGELEFALRERAQTGLAGRAGVRAAVDVPAQLS